MSEPTVEQAARPKRNTKAVRLSIAVLVTAGLASGAVVAAGAASASGPGSGSSSGSGQSATAPPAPGRAGSMGHLPTPGPHIDGVVRAVSGDTVTVTDPDGFTRVIAVSGSTKYTRNGTSSGEDAITTSRFVHAEGTVDANGTSLDATSIAISASAPAGPPAPAARPGSKTPPAPNGKTPPAPNGKTPPAPNGKTPPVPTPGRTAHGS